MIMQTYEPREALDLAYVLINLFIGVHELMRRDNSFLQ